MSRFIVRVSKSASEFIEGVKTLRGEPPTLSGYAVGEAVAVATAYIETFKEDDDVVILWADDIVVGKKDLIVLARQDGDHVFVYEENM